MRVLLLVVQPKLLFVVLSWLFSCKNQRQIWHNLTFFCDPHDWDKYWMGQQFITSPWKLGSANQQWKSIWLRLNMHHTSNEMKPKWLSWHQKRTFYGKPLDLPWFMTRSGEYHQKRSLQGWTCQQVSVGNHVRSKNLEDQGQCWVERKARM